MSIRLCSILFKFRIINKNYLVSTMFLKMEHFILNFRTTENCNNLSIKVLCKLYGLTHKLICDLSDMIIYLLSKDIYALIFF